MQMLFKSFKAPDQTETLDNVNNTDKTGELGWFNEL